MADNRGVTYLGPGKVEVRSIDYPTFEMRDGPGVPPASVGRKLPMVRSCGSWRQTSADRTSTWSGAGPPLP